MTWAAKIDIPTWTMNKSQIEYWSAEILYHNAINLSFTIDKLMLDIIIYHEKLDRLERARQGMKGHSNKNKLLEFTVI